MPIDEDELDRIIEPQWRTVLDSMEKGKFYSLNEMSERIVKKRLFDNESIKQFIPNYSGQRFVAKENMFVAMRDYLSNVAYVFSLLTSQLAVENLRIGYKDGETYFGKRYEL